MSFACVFGDFLKWFHILGQSSTEPPDQLLPSGGRNYFRRMQRSAFKFIPTMLLLVISIVVTIFVCLYSSFWDKLTYTLSNDFSKVINIQNEIILSIDTITIIVAVAQTLFLSSYFAELFAQITTIEHLSRKKITWDLYGLRRSVIWQMFCVCAGYMLPYTAILLTKPITANFLILLGGDFILKSLTLISYFQIIFYIELFNHMMKAFVKSIEDRAMITTIPNVMTIGGRNADARLIQLEIYYFKLMHFNLWEMAQTINYLFGWMLVIFVLHHFIFIVFIFFHTCVILLNPRNYIELIRE